MADSFDPDAGRGSASASGATAPFSSSYIQTRLEESRNDAQPTPTNAPSRPAPPRGLPPLNTLSLEPNTRLVGVSYPSQPSPHPSPNAGPSTSPDADAGPCWHQILQSPTDPKTTFRGPGFSFHIVFDPNSDDLLLWNSQEAVTLYALRISSEGVGSQTGELPIHIDAAEYATIPPGPWRVVGKGQERLEFYWLPRHFDVSMQSAQAAAPSSDRATALLKRAAPDDGEPSPQRQRLYAQDQAQVGPRLTRRGECNANAVLAEHTTSTHAAPAAPGVLLSQASQMARPGPNALLHLPAHQPIEVASTHQGHRTVEYLLTKRELLADQRAAQVIKAELLADKHAAPSQFFKALRLGEPLAGQGEAYDDPSRTPEAIVVKVLKVAHPPRLELPRAQQVEHVARVWLREFRAHHWLKHPSIVRLYGGDARLFSLYMEHVAAPDLSKYGDAGGCLADPEQRHRIALDSVSALIYIHDQGLRHNDIKPANILFSPARGAVVCDFGLACLATSPWQPGGTPGYLAPELLNAVTEPITGSAIDTWALGVTLLYVMGEVELPEKNARWIIAELRDEAAAKTKMQKWVKHVGSCRRNVKLRLENGELDELRGYAQAVVAMLDREPQTRKPLRDISMYLK